MTLTQYIGMANEWWGAIMLVCMICVIFIGFPISFTLLFLAMTFGWAGLGATQTFNLADLQMWGTMKDEILPAVPLFIFMGYMTEQAGLMERLFMALRSLLAPVRGALYLAVILTATIFAMATGIVGAAVTVLGIMAGPIMISAKYDSRLSSGAIAAGGTLGILIPPSVMLVVMGPTLGVPVNQLYAASIGPGFLLAGLYIAYTLIRSYINPSLGPALTPAERLAGDRAMLDEPTSLPVKVLGFLATTLMAPTAVWLIMGSALEWTGAIVWVSVTIAALAAGVAYVSSPYFRAICIGISPLAALISFTLGTILGGLATPTEAASCGAFGATLLAFIYGRLPLGDTSRPMFHAATAIAAAVGAFLGWHLVGGTSGAAFGALTLGLIPSFLMVKSLYNAATGTMVTSAMVLFLALASNIFGAIFAKLGTATVITNGLIALPMPDMAKLALIMVIIFLLGWPFEWPAIILVFLPIFLPVFSQLKLEGFENQNLVLIWFGTLVAVNLQTAFLSPPVAMSAYYLRNVVPQWSLATIYRGMADYMIIQIICLLILFFWPSLALWPLR